MKLPNLKIPYWYLLIGPALLYIIGHILNAIVVGVNHGTMPVFAQHCADIVSDEDWIHSCGTKASHLTILADWFVWPMMRSWASIGDFILLAGKGSWDYCAVIWAALMIKDVNSHL